MYGLRGWCVEIMTFFKLKTRSFCIENETLCIKNEELCIKNDDFCSFMATAAIASALATKRAGQFSTFQNPDFLFSWILISSSRNLDVPFAKRFWIYNQKMQRQRRLRPALGRMSLRWRVPARKNLPPHRQLGVEDTSESHCGETQRFCTQYRYWSAPEQVLRTTV